MYLFRAPNGRLICFGHTPDGEADLAFALQDIEVCDPSTVGPFLRRIMHLKELGHEL